MLELLKPLKLSSVRQGGFRATSRRFGTFQGVSEGFLGAFWEPHNLSGMVQVDFRYIQKRSKMGIAWEFLSLHLSHKLTLS